MKVFVFTSAWITQAFTSDRHFEQAGYLSKVCVGAIHELPL
ncbi:hypothetical protein [Nostoc sp. XA010]|nr:hypothetical protein [Nostoc sp. XA010]